MGVCFFFFTQICLYVRDVKTQVICDQRVPYAVAENQWVGFDNRDSLDIKVSINLNGAQKKLNDLLMIFYILMPQC